MKSLLCLLLLFTQSEPATVYFYRVEEANKLDSRKVGVRFGDSEKKSLDFPEDNFVGVLLPPGKYGVRMSQKRSEILLNVEAGKRYFVRVSQTPEGFGHTQSLTIVPEEQARFQMRDMKPLEAKNVKDKTLKVVREQPQYE
jgi:hypothetical protein